MSQNVAKSQSNFVLCFQQHPTGVGGVESTLTCVVPTVGTVFERETIYEIVSYCAIYEMLKHQ